MTWLLSDIVINMDMVIRLFRKVELVGNWIRENRFLRVFDGGS